MGNAVDDALAAAKGQLAKANSLTTSVEGTPTSHFAAPATPSHIKGVPTHEYSASPYSEVAGLKAKTDNVNQYKAAE